MIYNPVRRRPSELRPSYATQGTMPKACAHTKPQHVGAVAIRYHTENNEPWHEAMMSLPGDTLFKRVRCSADAAMMIAQIPSSSDTARLAISFYSARCSSALFIFTPERYTNYSYHHWHARKGTSKRTRSSGLDTI